MELFQVDDDGRLFISPTIEHWDAVARGQQLHRANRFNRSSLNSSGAVAQ